MTEVTVATDPCLADTRCKEIADRGKAEYEAQKHEAALASFRAAFALQPVPWLLFNMGRIQQKLGRTDEALVAYRTFLQQSQAPDESVQRDKARTFVEQIEQERAAQAAAERERAAQAAERERAAQAAAERERAAQAAAVAAPSLPPPAQTKPIYKKWWLWTLVGGAAAAVAVGTAIGVSAQKPDLSDVPRFQLFPSSR